MGIFSFRKGRKSPAQSTIPERLNLDIQHSTLLDRFSLEIGSARSASGWVLPDSIFSPTSPTWSSQNGDFGNSSLRLRGGEMQDFQDCDPNSPTTLERFLSWIDEDYYDEQFALRKDLENTQQIVQQTVQDLHGKFISPSVDDLNSDSDPDELGGCLLVTPPSTSRGPHHHLKLEEHNDVATAASDRIGDWLHNTTFHNMNQSSEAFTIDDDEDCEYDADIESAWSINTSILLSSDLPDLPDLADYEEFEAAECLCYDSLGRSTAASQPSALNPLYQEATEDKEEHTSCDGLLDSPVGNAASDLDFWAISEELRHLISRFHGVLDIFSISGSSHDSQQQQPLPLFPTAALYPSSLPTDGMQADSGLLRNGLGFLRETTRYETLDMSSGVLLFGDRIIDGFMFTFEHNGPRYPSKGCLRIDIKSS